jgi:hypothetical protein
MHSDSRRSDSGTGDIARSIRWQWLVLLAGPLASAGCEEELIHASGKPAALSRSREDFGPIIGQRTQKITEIAPAIEKGNAKIASTKAL